jgi:hypothetical protein
MSFTFKVQGIEAIQKRFAKLDSAIQEEIVEEIRDFGYRVNTEQQALISQYQAVDTGLLRQQTKTREIKDGIVIFSNAEYSPFVEFGTGKQVKIPPELAAVAGSFRGYKRGDFKQFLANLRVWCKRHGIDERAAYPIAIKILNNGLKARPFFFPPYLRERPKLMQTLRKLLK